MKEHIVVILCKETATSKVLNSATVSRNYGAISVIGMPFSNVLFFAITDGSEQAELINKCQSILGVQGMVCHRVFDECILHKELITDKGA